MQGLVARFDAVALHSDLRHVILAPAAAQAALHVYASSVPARVPAWGHSASFAFALFLVVLFVAICKRRRRYMAGFELKHGSKSGKLARIIEDTPALGGEKGWGRLPWWACLDMGGHLQTFGAACAKFLSSRKAKLQPHKRELLTLSTKAIIALDWADEGGDGQAVEVEPDTPILILLSGVFGHSRGYQISYIIKWLRAAGIKWRICIMVNSGVDKVPLVTSRMWSMGSTLEFAETVGHLKQQYPQAPVMAAGLSLGATLIGQYIAERGPECALAGAVLLSPIWNANYETPSYRQYSTWTLCPLCQMYVKRNREKLAEDGVVDMEAVLKAKTITDFDAAMSLPRFPQYRSVREWYEAMALAAQAGRIVTPTLALNAADDPVADVRALEQVRECGPGLAIAVPNAGGHCGFLEARSESFKLAGTYSSYCNRVLMDWLVSCMKHHS